MVNDLGASPHLQALIGVLSGFAWNLKMPVAFASDVIPVGGYRRKPYLYFGLAIYMFSFMGLAVFPPGYGTATVFMSLSTLGQMMAGVMCDTLIVENMRHESAATRGKLQTECWILMTLAGIGGTLAGGFVFAAPSMTNSRVFMINALIKLLVVPFAFMLVENPIPPPIAGTPAESALSTASRRGTEMWEALKQASVWQPTLFIFLFSIFPNPGTAMTNFFIEDLGFGEEELSYIAVVASVSGALGMGIYYRYFKEYNWHWFFATVIILSAGLSLTQLLLVLHVNRRWGVPDLAFALGDDAIVDVTCSLLAMPILILIASICPAGVESSLYAFVTSVQVAGGTVGGTISAGLIEGFGITLHNYDRLWQLVLLCALAKLLVLPFIPMLPTNLNNIEVGEKSWKGAALISVLLVGGICWALGQASYKLARES
mmetsp:Transcript_4203/g.6687  ORF Transcript_4203/g.6687 Transcript_4203/m.6687 type:complete len:430 (-) Transcript_4203:204-1493(-)